MLRYLGSVVPGIIWVTPAVLGGPPRAHLTVLGTSKAVPGDV